MQEQYIHEDFVSARCGRGVATRLSCMEKTFLLHNQGRWTSRQTTKSPLCNIRPSRYSITVLYLDNNATTRLAPDALSAMLPFLTDVYANPSTPCSFARTAALAIDRARTQVAKLVGSAPDEIIFTSGGTESNNSIIESTLHFQSLEEFRARSSNHHTGPRLIISEIEHASIRNPALQASDRGASIAWLAVSRSGPPSVKIAENLLESPAAIMSVMTANNETGAVSPVAELAALAARRNVLVHTDAVQAAGKIPLSLGSSGVHFASFSAHKIHGPKGIGALYIRRGAPFHAALTGGDQEYGFRAGTENVAGIVGFGVAAELAFQHLSFMDTEVRRLRDDFESRILHSVSDVTIAARSAERLPNTSMLLIPHCETEALLALLDLDQICVSSGSACTAGAHEPSHVLKAMGLPIGRDIATLRVSLSRFTTAAEIDALVAAIVRATRKLRSQS